MTLQDLRRNTKQYRDNFKLLLSSVGTPEHEIYVKEEIKLDKENIRIRKELHVFTQDPCTRGTSSVGICKTCKKTDSCDYYKWIRGKR